MLGDRVRMQAHAEDAGVFIRSMATRGHLGGLARTTTEAATVLDAAGFDVVIIETVGVGQDEVDIVRTADISVVTLVPGAGDDVQALKAGIMEIADIFVVNKADREGADRTAASIESMLSLGEGHVKMERPGFRPGEDGRSRDRPLHLTPDQSWRPPVLRTVATTGAGIPELAAAIDKFREDTKETLGQRRRTRAEWRLREILEANFMRHVETQVLQPGEFDAILDRIAAREVDPYGAAAAVLGRAVGSDRALDHVGIAAADATRIATLLHDLFGLDTGPQEDIGLHRLRFVDTGPATLELVEPLSPDAPVGRFLDKDKRAAGLHHVCLRVPDIDAALAALRAKGVRLIDEQPRQGAHGSRIAFIHPSSAAGLLLELKELPRIGHAATRRI